MENSNKTNLEKIIKKAEEERIKLKHPYLGSEHLFMALLNKKSELTEFLKLYNLTYKNFKKELINVVGLSTKDNPKTLYTPLLRKIIKRYELMLKSNQSDDINEALFISMLDEGEGIAIRIILKMDIDLDEIYFKLKEKRKIKEMQVSNEIGIFLNSTVDLNEKVVGREDEINKMILTLTRKKKCNPILIGPAGVGKTAIVEELARRIVLGKVPSALKDYKIFMIEMGSLLSGTKYRGEFEERLNKIIKEIINDGKTIIFIDEIHSMVDAGGAEGAINASDILKPYLARGNIKCIGATTTNEYNKSILCDEALARRFDVINIKEPTNEEMYNLLCLVKKEYEKYHDVKISKKVINKIIDLSDYYLKNIVNPDKSIDLLDSSCAYHKMNNTENNNLTINDVINTVFYKTNNCLIENNAFINKLKRSLFQVVNQKSILKICQAFNYEKNIPISILLTDSNIESIIRNNLKNINVIEIDFSSHYFSTHNSLCDDKDISETIFRSMVDKPFSLIKIKNINYASNYILDELIKINKEGFIEFKYKEKLYFNNSVIIVNIDESAVKQSGFSNKLKSVELPQKFVDSFKLDIREIKTKEIALSI